VQTLVLILSVLAIGVGFIFSYVGAFHDPRLHQDPIAVVAPQQEASMLSARLDGLAGAPLHAVPVQRESTARQQVRNDDVTAALVVDPRGQTDRLLVASGGGAALTLAVEQVLTKVDASQHRSVLSADVAPAQSSDYRGVSGFYIVIGWLIAGYFLAALLGLRAGRGASTPRRLGRRLLLLAPYSIAAGVAGMLIADTLLGALTGHFLALAGVGALLVFTAGAVTVALQELVGIAGIGIAVVLFVVLGNPSSGGAYQLPLLPGFWRAIGNAIPNGAGVDAVRRIVYFGSSGVTDRLLTIGAYGLGAIIVALAWTAYRSRRTARARRPVAVEQIPDAAPQPA